MPANPIAPGLALAVLAILGTPARAARTFTNRSEGLVCLVPDPKALPPAGIRVTPGARCVVREDGEPAEALAQRHEAKAGDPARAPIALRQLWPHWERAVLFLDPGGSVTFATGAGDPGPRATRFRLGIPERRGLDGIHIRPTGLELVFQVEGKAGTWTDEQLEGMGAGLADPGTEHGSGPGTFRNAGDQGRDLELVDRAGPSGCAIQ